MKYQLLILFIVCAFIAQAQSNNQTIKGTIGDKQSLSNLKNVTITILQTEQGTTSLNNGTYSITNVKPGRYDVKFSYIGYKELVLSNIIVSSGKETILDALMEESATRISEIKVRGVNKQKVINELATNSARTFSTEEVNRYAGGRSDPGRLVSNFAGVSTPNDSRNDIVIRGNAPTGVLWRIEGMNVPNPNHFATIGTTGGPVSALNTNMLKNSDFFTSAFPSEYGNATAGVFDLGFRKGNSEKREHTFQLGALTGLEAMTEGPIKKGNGSSYLLAYRYAFTGVAQQIGIPIGTAATPFYQDLAFKIVSGEGKYGRFTFFGMGGKSNITFDHKKIDSTDLFADPSTDSYFESALGLVGLKHFYKINSKAYLNTIIGANYTQSEFNLDTLNADKTLSARVTDNISKRTVYNANTSFNKKVNNKLFYKVGIMADVMNLTLNFRTRFNLPQWQQRWDYNDVTTLLQSYAHAKYNFSDKLIANLGLHAQVLTLNNSTALEPRAGLKYVATNKSTFSIGYGLHSQMQTMDVYFYRGRNANGTYDESNKNLDFTKSHHIVLGYDYAPAKNWRIKTEVYYQNIFNVPISKDTNAFSMLNNGASFNPSNETNLQNKGTGENYGLEITLEKFFSKGYYGLATGSFYDSKYKASDGIIRNTAFNGKYVANLLLGKEIKMGKQKQNTITADIKLTSAGGRFFTPVDLEASKLKNDQVEKGSAFAFTQQNPDFFRLDIKFGYTYNSPRRKISQNFSFDIQNVTNNKNIFAERYNRVTSTVNTAYQIGFFPNFIYRLQF